MADLSAKGYRPGKYYEENEQLRAVIDLISSGAFSNGDHHAFDSVVGSLLNYDRFMAFADYQSYLDVQTKIDQAYADPERWTRSAILNVARTGFFSSDRSMRDYIDRIWGTQPAL